MSPPSLEDGSLESSELWEGRSEEAKEFVQFLCSDTTAAAALLHPWLRNVLLRPGMSAEQLEDDARERMACCVVALLLIPTEMAQRDAESLLQDFNSFDQDDDGLIALVSAQKIMEKRGTRQAAAEAALAVADVRGAGVLDFSAMAAAAFLGDLVPRNGAARFVDLKSRLQALFFEAYGDEEEEGRVLQSDLRSSVVNSVGEILHVHGNVRFDELLSAFAEEEIDKDELLPPLAKAAGIGTSNSLFEFGFMAHEESSWLLKLLHTCGAGSSQRRRVYSC
ncbi:CPK13 [Symbiodinium microadriaticum]|nr:CPK13 [Symbiodinium microadriaticum]